MITVLGFSLLAFAGLLAGFYMAWNIGANDTANEMATSVASGALTPRQAVAISATFNTLGAVFMGARVVSTIGKGIVPQVEPIGALCAVIAASVFVTLATWKNMPVSTSHSIVGAMLGYGLVSVGIAGINWFVMANVILAWVLSPLAGIAMGFFVFKFIRGLVLERIEDVSKAERVYTPLQIMSASYEAFATGSNDVANAIAPVAVIMAGGFASELKVPIWLLAFGGIGIAVGTLMWGYKVMETIGKRITGDITPTRGFAAEYSAATVVLVCSYLGMPVSTTHASVGTVTGVGFAGGLSAVNLRIVGRIIAYWLLTVPIAALFAMALFNLYMVMI
ncbi:MAG: inorganic phosphate transporter [Methanocellales archaeon]|nr:inorganic phosphate transporter [Methanocellales archaeon]